MSDSDPAGEPANCLIVIFGASGDLTKRKLVPSLFSLARKNQLPAGTAVLGVSRTDMSDDAFRAHLTPHVKQFARDFDAAAWDDFATRIYYHTADTTSAESFVGLKARIGGLSGQYGTGQRLLFYLSVAPQLYEPIVDNLAALQMITEGKTMCSLNRTHGAWQRLIVEKPFGYDPPSAAHLNQVLGRACEEHAIYRIDHYLGKETVQNLLVFRFANAIFEPIWNSNYIDHVQVTAAESVGVQDRGGYYDSPSGGAMRDMIQSHLIQVMALVAMEPPVSMRADDIRLEKVKVLSATRGPGADEMADFTVRGHYGRGSMDGQAVPAYLEEQGVAPDSGTETYAALQLHVDTWRWGGVPFYLRSGKRMAKKLTEIVVNFKHTPHCLFREQTRKLKPNQIIINVQPDEGIRIRFEGKVPGTKMDIKDVVMDFDLVEQFNAEPPEAYATLLLDAIRGDQTLFKHREEVEHCWRVVQPAIDYWKNTATDAPSEYASGTWGPSASDIMMARDDRNWHNP